MSREQKPLCFWYPEIVVAYSEPRWPITILVHIKCYPNVTYLMWVKDLKCVILEVHGDFKDLLYFEEFPLLYLRASLDFFFERQNDKNEWETERSTIARGVASYILKPETPSSNPVWVTEVQIFQPSFTAFPNTSAGSWTDSKAARTWHIILITDHKWYPNPLCHNASLRVGFWWPGSLFDFTLCFFLVCPWLIYLGYLKWKSSKTVE